jgi:hypothetical protein
MSKKTKAPEVPGPFYYNGRILKIRNKKSMRGCCKLNSGKFDWTLVGKIVA